ncbi:efflux RND transporter permease subunit [Rhodanobacter sp. DHG33]|uniref:efflux RND transporter permease subunit n=1 Tax=Rhodanobacter sp. DHG33 TaxID=2775921 RepID=UPI0017836516|nr:efflux RND transporter permease subunit [Rhodanobacter sp. DHG33]MBD8898501.1 efflux RND transporter permease subunit [Rhodanobacter sp. DHG33]
MNLPALCIRRPVMTTLLMLALLIFGVAAYPRLAVNELPNVDYPTIRVFAGLPGASPEVMASAVAAPLEAQLSTIPGIDAMNSSSSPGGTSIVLSFALNRNIDAAAQDVQSAIAAAQRQLPPDMPTPPILRKVNPADAPVLLLAMTSPTLPVSQLDEYAETQLAQRLSTIDGVAQVYAYGATKYAVRISIDPDRLAVAGIGIDQVQKAVVDANVNQATGTLYGPSQQFQVRNQGQLLRAAPYNDIVLAWRNGAPVRLGDVGRAYDSVQNDQLASWYKHDRSVLLAIQRQPGANTVALIDRIKAVLPGFIAGLPPSVKLDVLYDRSQSIRASVADVQFSLLLAGMLVVLVVYLFLGNLSATLIPAAALLLSVTGTFGVMSLLDYSLDNLSLLALTLAVGFVVDDAIVMLENIMRHVETGLGPHEASLKGAGEIGFTILSMTLSLIAVFIPVMFMGGIVGRLFHEFVVTLSVAILVSGFVSITLTPMLCSRFVKVHEHPKKNGAIAVFNRGFEATQRSYVRSLSWCMGHSGLVMSVFAASLVATVLLFNTVPKDFIPAGDTGRLQVITEGPQDVSYGGMVARQQQLAEIVAKDPNIESWMSSIEAGGSTINDGEMLLKLKPASQRSLSVDEIVQELRKKFAKVIGMRAYVRNPPLIQIGGLRSKAQYQFTLQSTDSSALYDWSGKVTQAFATMPGFQDVTNDLSLDSPSIVVEVDRSKLAPLGLTMSQVQSALGASFSQNQLSTIYSSATQYWVVMEVQRNLQNDPTVLSKLYVTSNTGKLIPLDTVASFVRKPQVLTVNHQGQLPSVTVSFGLAPGVSLGDALADIHNALARIGLPATISGNLQGTAQAFQTSMQGMGTLLLLAVFVIYLVLGILYESFIHPMTILSGLPAAAVGALLTLQICHLPLDLFGFVGIVMLIGIVKKNAIMMIDFALARQRDEDMSPAIAIFEACQVRFRPIMMTTMAALAGALPIALGLGAGSEVRRPLGLVVVGGLLLSQLLTLYLTPVIYLQLDRLRMHFDGGAAEAVGYGVQAIQSHD